LPKRKLSPSQTEKPTDVFHVPEELESQLAVPVRERKEVQEVLQKVTNGFFIEILPQKLDAGL